ncbi:hypothetical protein KFU94_14770 [Chloroflexi bacterium TSY]|nr:hypothetical protein [Chloroflexi bacterium TSY]
MSEYQYYEFRTINRQLTAAERANVNKLSSHGYTTATSFSVDYSWGDFKHQPDDVLERYFDAFFYMANWGTVTLKFRYPVALVDTRAWEPYFIEESMTVDHKTINESVILGFDLNLEEGFDWIEPQGSLDGVLGLYHEILQGDHRALYLAWLRAIQAGTDYSHEFDDETLEPPVPPGLDQLSSALDDFVDLFELDPDLIAAAARGGETQPTTTQIDERAALEALTKEECVDFLHRLLQDEDHLELKLKQHIGLLQSTDAYNPTGQRTVGTLLAASVEAEELRRKAAAAAKEAARQAQLRALAARGDSAWQEVEDLIEQKATATYEHAANLLHQLGELASQHGETEIFASRVESIRNRYRRRSALMRELRRFQL